MQHNGAGEIEGEMTVGGFRLFSVDVGALVHGNMNVVQFFWKISHDGFFFFRHRCSCVF
jgi:hypothetical protein